MALIQCPECGKMISERAERCPQCGLERANIIRLLQEKEALRVQQEAARIREREKAAEEARIRKVQAEEEARIRIAKEQEEARIRAAKRAEWWQLNKKKVYAAIVIVLLAAGGAVAGVFISKSVEAKNKAAEERRALEQEIAAAKDYIARGDSCATIYRFDEAEQYFSMAIERTKDIDVRNTAIMHRSQLSDKRDAARYEYNEALRKLEQYLEADDYEFYPESDACLDKMIEIDPYNSTTRYYRNMRGR